EARLSRRDDQVARQRDLEAARQGEAFDRGDERLARRPLGDAGKAAVAGVWRLSLHERLEVHARREVAAGAGDDAYAQVVLGVEAVERLGHAVRDVAVDGVARIRPVDGDHEDAVAILGQDCLVAHAGDLTASPSSASSARSTDEWRQVKIGVSD